MVDGTDEGLRVSVALQAKRHSERLGVVDCLHLINLTMAVDTADTSVNVYRMVEINIIGCFMDLDPGNWFAGFVAMADGSKRWRIG